MNIKDFLKQSSLYNVLASESIISEDFREKLAKISKIIISIFVFVLLFLYFTKDFPRFASYKNFADNYDLVSRTAGLIFVNIGIFLYSQLASFYLSSTFYFEKLKAGGLLLPAMPPKQFPVSN